MKKDSILNKLIKEAMSFKSQFLLAVSAMLLSGAVSILPSWIVKVSIDGLSAIEEQKEKFNIIPSKAQSFGWIPELNLPTEGFHYILPLIIVAVFFLDAIFRFFYQYNSRKFGLLIVKQLREKFHWHLSKLSLSKQSQYDIGSLVSRVSSDLNNLQSWIAESVMNTFNESFKLVFLFAWLLVLDWKLTLISIVIIPTFALPVLKIGKKIRTYSKQGQDFIGGMSNFLTESLLNQRVTKAFNLENKRQDGFVNESTDLYKSHKKWAMFMALVSPITNVFGAIGIAAVLFFGLSSVSKGLLSVGEFSSFFVTSILLYDPVKRLGRVSAIIQSALGVAERVYSVLDEEIQENPANLRRPELVEGGIEYKNLNYSYLEPALTEIVSSQGSKDQQSKEKKELFKNLNLKIDAKTTTAVVGPSGSGKTSLLSLLPRFYELDSGEITIDGLNINELDLKDLRDLIALVTQDSLLFTGTIRDNILMGKQDANEEEVLEAAKQAHVLEFAMELKGGLDSHIGDRGQSLSVGQRQRVALARAFISDAPIMIFDEPTSALDNESEAYIYDAISSLHGKKTVLIIAHKLNTIKNSDRIIYMQEGKILESGTHEELSSQGGAYSKLLQEV